jgi:hypothetical protein
MRSSLQWEMPAQTRIIAVFSMPSFIAIVSWRARNSHFWYCDRVTRSTRPASTSWVDEPRRELLDPHRTGRPVANPIKPEQSTAHLG